MKKPFVIDGTGHLLGRLSSTCAKYLLQGNKVVILNCSRLQISGKKIRSKIKYTKIFNKKTATNPQRGPLHFKSPSQIFWRTVRGMLPYKIKKGLKALLNLRVYDGVPYLFSNIKKFVIPENLRVLKLSKNCKYCDIKDISFEIGWKNYDIVQKINNEDRLKNRLYYINKMEQIRKKFKYYEKKINID
nr:60S ribosomal protein L13A [Cryptomonas paramecium]